jgi:pyruvate,orthophosphate dikinase
LSARKKVTARRAGPKKAGRKKSAAKKAGRKQASLSAASRRGASDRQVFFFGGGAADGHADLREVLGGKGANLAEMCRLGLPVPPGLTVSTAVCVEFNRAGGKLSSRVQADVLTALARVEKVMGRRFGDSEAPLLVSVRSGARVSMPGMMDTVLNLGLNDRTVEGLANAADERFAFDSYRRFIQMYGDVVLGVPHGMFEEQLDAKKRHRGALLDTDLDAADLRELVREFLDLVEEQTGALFPQDPAEQLWGAIGAVFGSWQNDRAITYRRLNDIPEGWGTAVNVQAMVFGNMGENCATGVAFTRDPSTGAKHFYGEYLKNAQGEDVVAGIRTPQPINDASRKGATANLPTLESEMPRPYKQLVRIYKRLERHYRDMQDIEFTIESGELWMLQTRSGKRTAAAALKIAVDMAKERLISREEAVTRVDPEALDQLLHPQLDPDAKRDVLARGLPASPGAAVGKVVFSADRAEANAKAGEKVVLVRVETSPDDIHGMHAAEGILTARGGMTSHAAVVARGFGKCCVVGCGELQIDYATRELRVGGRVVKEGEPITMNGSTGEVMIGRVPTIPPKLGGAFDELMRWADRLRKLRVRTNADSPEDAQRAREFGAEGIGLCRTEHMFFDEQRILVVRRMLMAERLEDREKALEELLPMQRGDFQGIFRAMDGLPVTIRLLDPPLHEFLPKPDDDDYQDKVREIALGMGVGAARLNARIKEISEVNPMLGHRGCRLGVSYPEIYRMQVRAITEAAFDVVEEGLAVKPEIMVPLVAHPGELLSLRAAAEEVIASVRSGRDKALQKRVKPTIGTMIEVPRAALTADVIARSADFFSFGTNDLTQMTYALSRDDAGKFLPAYIESGILEADPFVSIDEEGVGQLVETGVEKGRATRPDIKLGICGEHGGDPRSVHFFARVGLDYVSCSPYRVPIARLAAAQAAIEQPE